MQEIAKLLLGKHGGDTDLARRADSVDLGKKRLAKHKKEHLNDEDMEGIVLEGVEDEEDESIAAALDSGPGTLAAKLQAGSQDHIRQDSILLNKLRLSKTHSNAAAELAAADSSAGPSTPKGEEKSATPSGLRSHIRFRRASASEASSTASGAFSNNPIISFLKRSLPFVKDAFSDSRHHYNPDEPVREPAIKVPPSYKRYSMGGMPSSTRGGSGDLSPDGHHVHWPPKWGLRVNRKSCDFPSSSARFSKSSCGTPAGSEAASSSKGSDSKWRSKSSGHRVLGNDSGSSSKAPVGILRKSVDIEHERRQASQSGGSTGAADTPLMAASTLPSPRDQPAAGGSSRGPSGSGEPGSSLSPAASAKQAAAALLQQEVAVVPAGQEGQQQEQRQEQQQEAPALSPATREVALQE